MKQRASQRAGFWSLLPQCGFVFTHHSTDPVPLASGFHPRANPMISTSTNKMRVRVRGEQPRVWAEPVLTEDRAPLTLHTCAPLGRQELCLLGLAKVGDFVFYTKEGGFLQSGGQMNCILRVYSLYFSPLTVWSPTVICSGRELGEVKISLSAGGIVAMVEIPYLPYISLFKYKLQAFQGRVHLSGPHAQHLAQWVPGLIWGLRRSPYCIFTYFITSLWRPALLKYDQ